MCWREVYKQTASILIPEVIKMIDLSNKTIQELFYEQVRRLTLNEKLDSFDQQFSEGIV